MCPKKSNKLVVAFFYSPVDYSNTQKARSRKAPKLFHGSTEQQKLPAILLDFPSGGLGGITFQNVLTSRMALLKKKKRFDK